MDDPKRKEMSRSTQTKWIVGAILAVGLLILHVMTRLPDTHRFAKCQIAFGILDGQCKLNVILDHWN